MGSIITTKKGLLKLVKGQIEVEVNGSNQPAKDGEQLPKGAVLHIGENATYEITFDDGTKLSNEVEPSIAATPNAGGQATQDEIQALQDLIASGEDPTQNLPETAAGNAPAGRDGNSGYVTLARDGTEALATSGYSTSGQTLTAATTAAPEQTVATDSPSVLVNDSITVDEDTVASGNVLDNDSDADNVLSVVGFNINGTDFAAGTVVTLEGGSFILNADGSYTFTPNENWNGQVPVITYTTNTGSTATLTINVTPVDDPSVLANDTNTVAEDTVATGNVLDNDSDIDNTLSVVSYSVNGQTIAAGTAVTLEGGSLLINADGSYTFTPNANWNGQVPVITYTTNTGSTATLTIEVTPVDDPSVLANDSNTVPEDTVAAGNVLDNDSDIDNTLSVVSYSVNGQTIAAGTAVTLEGGSLLINADGSYTFTPNANWNGQVPVITYTTNTGSTATLTIEVTPVDDPSVLANDSNTVPEDTVAAGNVLDNDSDIDNTLSVVSYSVNGQTIAAGTAVTLEGGSLLINADGSYTFTPNANWNGQVPVITYTTNTGSTATLTIEVTPVDDPSVLANDSNTVPEDTVAAGNVLDNDSDIDNTLSVVSYSVNGQTIAAGTAVTLEGGSLLINADGSYTFTPNANWNGQVPVITYTTNTGSTATLTIEVTPVDDPSALANDSNTVPEDTVAAGNVLDNDSDIDNTLSVVSYSVNGQTIAAGTAVTLEGGSLLINADGSYTFTPNANWNGQVPVITYTTNTGSTATLTIEVTPVDDPSVLANDSNTVPEDTVAAGNVLDNDSDIDNTLSVVSYSVNGQTIAAGTAVTLEGGSLLINADGSYTFTPNANWNGQVPVITYTTNTGSTATLTIEVTPVDDPSALANDSNTVPEDTVAAGNVLDNDSDIDNTLSVVSYSVNGQTIAAGTAVTLEGGSLLINADGSYTFTPNANWNGQVPVITYTTNTGSTATLTIEVTPVNDAPETNDLSVSGDEDAPSITIPPLSGSDSDGSVVSFTIDSLPANGTLLLNGVAVTVGQSILVADAANLTFTPNANWNGETTFTYHAVDNDGLADSTPATVTITVDSVNDAPETNDLSVSGDEDAPSITIPPLSGSDSDGSVVSFTIDSLPANGTLLLNGVAVTVGQSILVADAANLTFTPNANWNGETTFTYHAVDNDGLADSTPATVTITVDSVNDAPETNDLSVSGDEDAPSITIPPLSGSDSDGSVVSFTIDSLPANGTLLLNGVAVTVGQSILVADAANLTFTPNANWNGETTFTYHAVDNDGLADSTPATVTITVDSVNDAPETNDLSVSGDEDAPSITIPPLSGSDSDGSVVSFTIDSLPANGTLLLNGVAVTVGQSILVADAANLTFTPNANWNGETTFTYHAVDNDGLADSTPATVTITVDSVNDAPETNDLSVSGDEDAPSITIPPLSGSDSDGSVVSFTIDSLPANGTLLLNGVAVTVGQSILVADAANLTFTPNANWNGETTFTYHAVDNDGLADSTPATVTITVDSVNDAPETNDLSVSGDEDAPSITIPPLSGSDSDGSVVSFTIDSLPANGTLLLNGVAVTVGQSILVADAANLTFTPNANWNGETTFTYHAVDNDGLADSTPATVTITVDSVNDAPETNDLSVSGDEDAPSITIPPLSGSDSDGSVVSFTIDSLPANGTLLLNGVAVTVGQSILVADAANLTFTPNANWNGETTFTYHAVDNDGLADSTPATVTITVDSVNDAPETNDLSVSGDEDAPSITIPPLSGSDSDGSVVSFTIDSLPANGTLLLNGVAVTVGQSILVADAANLTFTPNANWNGETTFTYHAVDNDGLADSTPATVTITVDSVNDAPETNDLSVSGDEDAPSITIPPLSGSDSDGSVVSFTIDSLPANGTLLLNGVAVTVGQSILVADAANLTFTPNANWNGETTFTYHAVDNDGLADSTPATVTITVDSVNDAPETNDLSVSGDEDAPSITIPPLSGSDSDGSVVSFTIDSLPANGTLLLNGVAVTVGQSILVADAANLTFTPNANWNGETTFTYHAVDNDGLADSTPATVTITVDSVNDAPETNDLSVSGDEDAPSITIPPLSGSDSDGSVVSFTIDSLPANGTLLLNGVAVTVGQSILVADAANLTFTPNANWNGETTFTYHAVDNDGLADSTPATVTITVDSVNDAPETNDLSVSGDEDAPSITIPPLSGSDSDGSVVSFTIDSLPANGTLLLNGVAVTVGQSILVADAANLTFTPNANWNGETTFTYHAVDNDGLADSTPATVTITVDSVNDAPETNDLSVSGDEDAPGITIPPLSGSDSDGSVVSFTIDSLPANGTLLLNGVAVTVGQSILVADAANLTFTPNANWNGETTFTYHAVDNDGLADSTPATVTITVDSVNDAPETNDLSVSGDEDAPSITIPPLSGSDSDGSVVSFTIDSLPANGTLLLNGVAVTVGQSILVADAANLTFTPNANWNGETTFTYHAVDNDGLADSTPATVTITVDSVNDAPETNDLSVSGDEDAPSITIPPLSGSDSDGSVVSFTIDSLPANGTLLLNGVAVTVGQSILVADAANLTFTPNANWNGETTFTYHAVDNDGLADSTPATVTITVDSVNDAPETNDLSVSGDEDAPSITIPPLSGSDSDGSVVSFTIDSLPANGTLLLNGVAVTVGQSILVADAANLTFTPNANWNGETTFTYHAVDNDGLADSTPATVTITVDSVNDAPETNDLSVSGDEDAPSITIPPLSGSDSDGSVVSFTIDSLPANGTLLLNGVAVTVGQSILVADAANLTFTPNANWNGETTFTYHAVDNDGLADSTPATVTITVDSVNDAPETNDLSVSGDEDAPSITIPPLSGSDSDGSVVSFTIDSLPANGTLLLNGVAVTVGQSILVADAANLTFTPNANWNGETTFTYHAVDNDGLADSTPATVTITVDSVNDAPETNDLSVSGDEDAPSITIPPLSGSDSDGSVVSFTIDSLPANGTLLLNGVAVTVGQSILVADAANLTFTPNANWNGETTFTYHAVDNDGLADSTPATVTITVDSVNDAPETNDLSVSGDEDAPSITIPPLSGSDSDGSVVSFTIDSLPANGTLLLNGVAVTVGQSILVADAANLTFTPNANWNGETTFTYHAVDNDGLADSTPATVTITVDSVNDAPETNDLSVSGDEDAPGITIPPLSGSDSDGSVVSFTIDSLPANGTLLLNGVAVTVGQSILVADAANLTFTPNANWNGETTFTYHAVDNDGLADSTPATVTITVDSVNDAPETNDLSVSGDEDAPSITIPPLSGSDSDGSVVSFTIDSLPANGTLLLNGVAVTVGQSILVADAANLTFTPNANWNGETTFTYHAVDNDGLADSTPATVTITVDSVNDAPETNDLSVSGDEDAPSITIPPLSGSDSDGSVVSFTIDSLPANGTLLLNGVAVTVGQSILVADAANLTFTPNANWNGETTFTYHAVDNDGLADSTPATVTITVDSVNDAPETNDLSVSGDEDAPSITIPPLSGSDSDGSVVSFTIDSLPANGTLLLNGVAVTVGQSILVADAANLTFTPNANWNGETTFTYHAVDNDGLADPTPATVTITVNPVDDEVKIIGLDGTNKTVYEANLATGTSPNNSALTQTGNFSFTCNDGLLTVTIGGVILDLTDLQALSVGTPVTINTDYGTLLLTGFSGDATGGTVSYTYTLNQAVDNDDDLGATDSGFTDSFEVVVEDIDHDEDSATLDIRIVDDSVIADIADSEGENSSDEVITGYFTDPVKGADTSYTADLSVNIAGWTASDPATWFAASNQTTGDSETIYYYVSENDPNTLYAYTDSGNPPTGWGGSGTQELMFTLVLNPNDGTYELVIHSPITTETEMGVNFTTNIGGNNYILYVNESGAITKTAPASTAFTLTATTNGAADTVNSSTNGYGVGSGKDIGNGELLTLTFSTPISAVETFVFTYNSGATYTGEVTIILHGVNANGDPATITLVGTSATLPAQIEAQGWESISRIDLTTAPNGQEFNLHGLTTSTLEVDPTGTVLNFNANIVDSDGDIDNNNPFSVTLNAPSSPSVITPVAFTSLVETKSLTDVMDTDSDTLVFKAGDKNINNVSFSADLSDIHVVGIRQPMSWRIEDGVLIGSMPGRGDLLKLTLDWDAIEAGKEGAVVVEAELLGRLPHNIDYDSLSVSGIKVVATDSSGQTVKADVTVSVADSQHTAVNDSNQVNVQIDSFEVRGVTAKWTRWTAESSDSNVRTYDSDDDDTANDIIRWGSVDGGARRSGYNFDENTDIQVGDVGLNQNIVLGKFTHHNYPIDANSAITKATLEVTLMINGVPAKVTLEFDHNETGGNGYNPPDIVTVANTSSVFIYDGARYTLQVMGFLDNSGNVVTSIQTAENNSTSFPLVVKLIPGDGFELPTINGNVLHNDIQGADGNMEIYALSHYGNNASASNGSFVLQGTYGTLTLNSDGTYTYQVTTVGSLIPNNAVDKFSYTIRDSDGDLSSAELNISVNAVNGQPIAPPQPDETVYVGGQGVDSFQLNEWIGEKGLFAVSLGGHGSVASQTINDTISLDTALHVKAGASNDFVDLGISTANNIVETGSSLPNVSNQLSQQDVLNSRFMSRSTIVDNDDHLKQNVLNEVQPKSDTVNLGEGDDTVYGGEGTQMVYGGAGNDLLIGGAGIDGLRGGEGNDTLIGGLGDDVLRGDGGSDTFVWRYADADQGTDHIMDFKVSQDKLDLSDLLQGETANTLESYLQFSLDNNGSTVIDIDANKDGVFDQHIVLDGVNLFSQYSATDNAGVINGLLGTNGNGPLIIDAAPVTPDAPQGVTPLTDPHNNNGTIIP